VPLPDIERILIYRAGAMGDAMVAVPAIQHLRRAYPGARFALMSVGRLSGRLDSSQVLGEFGWFDELITYAQADWRSLSRLRALLLRVRRFRADLVVHLGSAQNSPLRLLRDRAFFAAAGTGRFVSRSSSCVTWYGRLRRDTGVCRSEVDELLQVARAAGATEDNTPRFDLPIDRAVHARVDALQRDASLDPGRPLIALCPGSAQPSKRWPVERYEVVARRLIDSGANIVIVGGPQEASIGAALGTRWPSGRWWNAAAHHLTTREMAAVLQRCALYVGNDTGPMHVAAAVGTRCVAVFGAQHPEGSWHPYGDGHVVLRTRPACSNCYLSDCTRYASKCLTDIPAETVWRACEQALMHA
jgi:ADP-heptose:LPS heptosyltransferase